MHIICVALNKERGVDFIQESSADEDDQDDQDDQDDEMIFSYADFCIGLLAVPNNREFTRRNRVSGHFC